MTEDRFFERLRDDARSLRYEPEAAALTRIAARIRARVAEPAPTVAQLLAAWFRPLAATLSAVALAAALGIALAPSDDDAAYAADPVEISMAGDNYSVGE